MWACLSEFGGVVGLGEGLEGGWEVLVVNVTHKFSQLLTTPTY